MEYALLAVASTTMIVGGLAAGLLWFFDWLDSLGQIRAELRDHDEAREDGMYNAFPLSEDE